MEENDCDRTIPRFCRLPKVHKDHGVPLCPIVSLPRALGYRLAKALRKRFLHLLKDSDSINSSEQFLQLIKNIKISNKEIMVSFEITALFTSINIDLAKQTIHDLFTKHQDNKGSTPTEHSMSTDAVLKLLELCLPTHFKFNSKIYKQI